MRTSRVSQETARLINALSTRRKTRSSTGVTTNEDVPRDHTSAPPVASAARLDGAKGSTEEVKEEADSDQESSGLSEVPSDLDEDLATRIQEGSSKKRKREGGYDGAGVMSIIFEYDNDAMDSAKSLDSGAVTSSSNPKRTATAKPPTTASRKRTTPMKPLKSPETTTTTTPTTQITPPSNWERVYSLTQQMRSRTPAPVDTMGCETLALTTVPPATQRFQTLISLMLSSQTKDTVTAFAMRRLQTELPGGLTIQSVLEVNDAVLDGLIGKVGFHNNKTRYIKSTASILLSKYSGDIPDTIAGLTSLPGVGPKMAYLTMSAAWGRDEGIGVDVHVHRITNLWGWHKTKTPEETRKKLEAWLPRERWHGINTLLVGFGQTVCLPVGRRCGECSLAQEGLCPSAVTEKTVRKVKKEKVEAKGEGDGEAFKEQGEERLVVKEEPVNKDVVVRKGVVVDLPLPMDIEDIGVPVGARRARRGRVKTET